jgi:hypothetical protein
MTVHPPSPHGEPHPAGHEPDRVHVRSVAIIGIVLAAVVAGSLFGLSLLYARLQPPRESAMPSAWRRAERPPIDYDQPAQLRALREWENKELHTFGWRDAEKTTARVSIERAMEMLLEHGDPFAGGEEPAEIEPANQQNKIEPEKTDEAKPQETDRSR